MVKPVEDNVNSARGIEQRTAEALRIGGTLAARGWQFMGWSSGGLYASWQFGDALSDRFTIPAVSIVVLRTPDTDGSYVAEICWDIPYTDTADCQVLEGYVTNWEEFVRRLPQIESQQGTDPHPFPDIPHYSFTPAGHSN